ncbi:tetratricopeptide repeat protein [Leptospira jelokensis]|uniref:Tetratricopeptide repeat protein n=1 Tax=Leptospira jelokensis TaxID=2484931 RepID=A0A4Z0ZWZ7_9LEPT|nr:tetratricopeptide repeat protein [Leptospira jelokensis]TGL75561.1 tetratricopeptide repeat protein [Leptospira jelokensis]TGM04983.1 tetratricopeptide repeat protein [Leptospira jelokensis]
MKFSIHLWTVVLLFSQFPVWADSGFEESRYPTIAKAIHASILPDKKSIRIDWDPPKQDGEIIVARSNVMIDSPDKLYIADSLGRYKASGPNATRVYFDYNLKPGTYYYAIVMVTDVRRREVKMFANQNYTIIPVTIAEENGTPVVGQNPDFPAFPEDTSIQSMVGGVSGITANIEKRFIRLNWTPPAGATAGRTIYTVYRSNSPLTSLPLMQKAEKLSELTHPTVTFLDQDLSKSQTLYYGVSVKQLGGEETLPLEDKKSTLRVFYIKQSDKANAEVIVEETPKKQNPEVASNEPTTSLSGALHVRGLGYERVGKGAVISWLSPEDADETTIYSLYASIKPLNQGASSFNQGTVVKVATVVHPKTNFFIKELKEIDELYFGVTAKSSSVPEDYNLKENVSYFKYDFTKDNLPKEETNIVAESKPQKEPEKPEIYKNEHVVTPTEIAPPKENIEPTNDFKEEHSATVTYDLGQTELNRIIKETVIQKKFETAVYRLEEYLKYESNSYLRGKAMFFLGVSALKTGDTKKALKCFLKKETKSYSPSRVEFWTNQTLNQVGRGTI